MTNPERLYAASEIASMLGVTRHWVAKHHDHVGAPQPEYSVMRADDVQLLWTAAQLDHWRAYFAGDTSIPRRDRYSGFSDHKAVNQMGPVTITWKLWWRNDHDGGTGWWFSSPVGWWVSADDGRTWRPTESMTRPSDYRYLSVNGNAQPKGAVAMVLREAEKLRHRISKMVEP